MPELPLPSLEDTLTRHVDSLKPLCTPSFYSSTCTVFIAIAQEHLAMACGFSQDNCALSYFLRCVFLCAFAPGHLGMDFGFFQISDCATSTFIPLPFSHASAQGHLDMAFESFQACVCALASIPEACYLKCQCNGHLDATCAFHLAVLCRHSFDFHCAAFYTSSSVSVLPSFCSTAYDFRSAIRMVEAQRQ